MKVLFCASECVPFVKTGGLADVVGSLPKELLKQGCDVRVVIPKYRVIDWSYIVSMEHICHFQLPFGDGSVFCGIDSLEYEGVRFYFIDNLAMFGHDGVYTGDEQEGFRYAFFCRICRIQKFEDCKAILDVLSAFKLCKSCCLYKSISRME